MSKYSSQIKHLRKNYTPFHLDFKNEELLLFKQKCKNNKTTPTTEIKKFVRSYIIQ